MTVVRPRVAERRLAQSIRIALFSSVLSISALEIPLVHADAQMLDAIAIKTYNIPAGPLGRTLASVAVESGIALSFDPELTDGHRNVALTGNYSVRDAVDRLLDGSGLQIVAKSDGSYTLRKLPAGAEQATTLRVVKVQAETERNATTEGTGSYTSGAVTIGKTELKLKDIPQSLTVLTRQRMDDQNIETLPDILNSVTGVTFSKSPGPGGFITARGFELGTFQYDGVPVARNTYALGSYITDTAAFYDRVEVLRGAAGMMQGADSAGGAINFVRKRGQSAPTLTLTGKAGSWDTYGAQADVGGPLNDEGTMRGRAVVDYEKGNSFVDYVWNWEQKIYAALDYDLSANTTIGFGVSNRKSHYRPYFLGLPRYNDTSDIGLPRSTFTGSDWNRAFSDQTTVHADLTHRFNEIWQLKLAGVSIDESNEATYQYMVGEVAQDGSGSRHFEYSTDFANHNRGLDLNLAGNFDGWGVNHETLLGANYSKFNSDDVFARIITPGANIFDIDHQRPWLDFTSIENRGSSTYSQYDVEQYGVYGSWRVQLFDALKVNLGGRSSWYNNTYEAQYASRGVINHASDYKSEAETNGRFTPYAGAVYALNDHWSAYGSYAEVFLPQSQRTAMGSQLKPITGDNLEFGLKGELADGRINTSFAVFRYDQKNRAVQDRASGFLCDGWYCSIASGEIRAQGAEAEISGEVLPRLQASVGYAFTTTRYLSDLTYEDKVASTWTPKHMLRAWTEYQLSGALSQLRLGGGVNVQSGTIGFNHDFDLPGFAIWSARAAYQLNSEILLAINANNLFDKTYYIPGYNEIDANNYYGDPRNVMFTVKYTPQL